MSSQQAELIRRFSISNPSEARGVIDAAIAEMSDPMAIARMEILREYLCNPEFKAKLSEHSYASTMGARS